MYKIAVLGERESVMGFAALGLAVFPVESAEEAAEAFHRLTRQSDAYAIIYVTETYAAALQRITGKPVAQKMLYFLQAKCEYVL